MLIRAMQVGDIEAVYSIEQAVAAFPWSKRQFETSLTTNNDTYLMVEGDTVFGFAIFLRVLDETSLLNIAVAPSLQGKGNGKNLLNVSLQSQQVLGVRQCFLEVRESNLAAQALYFSIGFNVVGERKNYYPAKKSRENALVMCKELIASHLENVSLNEDNL